MGNVSLYAAPGHAGLAYYMFRLESLNRANESKMSSLIDTYAYYDSIAQYKKKTKS